MTGSIVPVIHVDVYVCCVCVLQTAAGEPQGEESGGGGVHADHHHTLQGHARSSPLQTL